MEIDKIALTVIDRFSEFAQVYVADKSLGTVAKILDGLRMGAIGRIKVVR